jgi:hypothetical protein
LITFLGKVVLDFFSPEFGGGYLGRNFFSKTQWMRELMLRNISLAFQGFSDSLVPRFFVQVRNVEIQNIEMPKFKISTPKFRFTP